MPITQSLLQGVIAVLLAPFNYIAIPVLSTLWQLAKHSVVIPCLLVVRIALYGTVYLPLTVVLSVANVPYDTMVPVEVSLYRIAVAAWPHVTFLLLNLLHYFIVSVIIGVAVGVISGANMLVVGYLLTWPTPAPAVSVKTQTTPYFNAKAELAWDKHAAHIKHEPRGSPQQNSVPSTIDLYMRGDSSLLSETRPNSLHGLHSFDGLDTVSHNDLSFSTIKEESEPDEPGTLTEQEALAGLGFRDTVSSVPSLFSKGHNGDTFSTSVSNRAANLRHSKQILG